jgi:MFS family permease
MISCENATSQAPRVARSGIVTLPSWPPPFSAIAVPARRLGDSLGGGPRSSDYYTLAEITGCKPINLPGLALFGVFSLLCGMADAVWQVILSRILFGFSGAGLGTISVVTLGKAVGRSARDRPWAFSLRRRQSI